MLNDYIHLAVSFDATFKWFGKTVCSNVIVLQQCFHLGLGSAHVFLDRTQNSFLFAISPPVNSGKKKLRTLQRLGGKKQYWFDHVWNLWSKIISRQYVQYKNRIFPARGPKQCGVRILKGKVERTQWGQASRKRAALVVKAWCSVKVVSGRRGTR